MYITWAIISNTYLVLLEELLILEHVPHSGGDGHLLPCLECLGSVLYGGVELGLGGLGDLADELLGSL